MNILDMYWKCFYFMYSNMYQSPRKSRLLDFHLEISVFRKAWERLKAVFSNVCLSISLTDFPLVHRCFVYVYAGEQNGRGLTCAWLNCHSSLTHTSSTLFGRSTRNTLSSLQKLCSSPEYLAQPGKALAIMNLITRDYPTTCPEHEIY